MVVIVPSIRSFRGKHSFLSNFYICNVTIDDETYETTEHYYQSQKATNEAVRKAIASASSAKVAKKMGRNIVCRTDWDDVKDTVMLKALRAKFSIPELAKMLVDTGNAIIEESNEWGDVYWGIDSDTGKGQNKLGKMLMQIRDEIHRGALA
jgi:hypothetical protein